MSHTLTFEAAADKSSAALPLHVAILLRQMRIDPAALNWFERIDGSGLSVWMLLARDESRLQELNVALKATDGVRNLVLKSAGPLTRTYRGSPTKKPTRCNQSAESRRVCQ